MQFWSKGLGKKTINLYLSKGETIASGGQLYVKGRMEAPVDWDYIMPLQGDDIIDFFDLLKDPTIPAYIHRSPRRWQLYGAMLVQGLRLGGLVAAGALRQALGLAPQQEDVVIQVPPPSVRKKKKARAKKAAEEEEKKPRRRRLSSRTTSAPSLTSSMKPSAAPAFASLESEEDVQDAIKEAMEAAESLV